MKLTHNARVFKRWLRPTLEFKWQDMWIGGYHEWKTVLDTALLKAEVLHIWICLLPCLPIHLQYSVETYYVGPK